MNEKTSHYLHKCLRNKPPHTNGTLLGVMMENNEGHYAPFLLLPVLLFLWLLLVAVWQYLQLLTRVRCPGHRHIQICQPHRCKIISSSPVFRHHKQARLD